VCECVSGVCKNVYAHVCVFAGDALDKLSGCLFRCCGATAACA